MAKREKLPPVDPTARRKVLKAVREIAKAPHGFEKRNGKRVPRPPPTEQVEREAKRVLKTAGITEPHTPAIPDKVHPIARHAITPSWRVATKKRGLKDDTPEDIAARALDCLHRVRVAIKRQDADTAAEEGVTLGALGMSLGVKMVRRLPQKAAKPPAVDMTANPDAKRKEFFVALDAEEATNRAHGVEHPVERARENVAARWGISASYSYKLFPEADREK